MPNNNVPAPSRRALLRGSGAALVVGGISTAPVAAAASAALGSDAELIRLCADFDTWERRSQALYRGHPACSQAEADVLALDVRYADEQHKLLDQICDLPCTTPASICALGSTLALYVGEDELEDGYKSGTDNRLLAALLRGITGRGVVRAAGPADNLDAELLALCGEFNRHHADARSLPDTGDHTWEDAQAARWKVSDQIEDMCPMTDAGHRAKAATALVLLEEQHGDSGDADIQFALATLRDLAGRA